MGISRHFSDIRAVLFYCNVRYSRRVLWLHAGNSNNNPRVIAWYYLQCVQELKGTTSYNHKAGLTQKDIGVPRLLRTDCGTENTNLSFIQPFLRRTHSDSFSGFESFRYGKSVTNQVGRGRGFIPQGVITAVSIAN